MQQSEINKSLIRDFYRRAVGQGDIAFAQEIIAEDYIQHSPGIKPGKAGILEALHAMKQMPKPAAPTKPFMRLIAEGDYVVTNLSFDWGEKQKAVVDVFRFQHGKVAEHWDAIQDQPETTLNGHPLLDGALEIEDLALTVENKQLVQSFYQQVFVDREVSGLADFVTADLVQHKPEIENGLGGLKAYIRQEAPLFSVEKVNRIIAEGNFVVVQAEVKSTKSRGLLFDIFRLRNRKIVEQWSIQQILPD
ncbi:nuclear transport factor 2 family protein [Tellurirhabdus bombi]|uniref:nuclear transport factor 2 family protein n=1 Tax=Tellurirhabdus bombi TaxID=2907205 RepID=UPI001F1934C0|nr:nuclear transport factor 2 family protein [Tellurirhabdus bombi]